MGRAPCCDKSKVKRGPWSPDEDATLKTYILNHGTGGNWIALPQKAGLKRCGKSCRLRWLNYLRPDINHGAFSEEEDNIICNLYSQLGSRWSIIASKLQGRTDNDVKNHWNTKLKKKFFSTPTNPINNNNSPKSSLPFLVPKSEAYNPVFSPFPCQNSSLLPSLNEANYTRSSISSSFSSIVIDHSYDLSSWTGPDGYSMNFEDGFLEDVMGGFESLKNTNSSENLGNYSPFVESKAGIVLCQNVTVSNYDQYY